MGSTAIYFIKVVQYDETAFGVCYEYDLRVYTPVGSGVGLLYGTVQDQYGNGIDGAVIRVVGQSAAAISQPNGAYLMFLPVGTYTITAQLPGGEAVSQGSVTISSETNTALSPVLPVVFKGDLNDDGVIDLEDLLLVLKTLAGIETTGALRAGYAQSGADVDGDGMVGAAEASFLLQEVSGSRP